MDRWRDLLVRYGVETAAGHLGGEPVGLGESDRQWDEVLFNLLRRQIVADLVEGFDGLSWLALN